MKAVTRQANSSNEASSTGGCSSSKEADSRNEASSRKNGQGSQRQDLKKRTKEFALRVVKLYVVLPERNVAAQVLGKQILRCGTSVGAQYREACRAKSNADFVSKIEGALQELDETLYWLELLGESRVLVPTRLASLYSEAEELIAIFVTMVKSVKQRVGAQRAKGFIPHPSAFIP
jgi:four helix bundle protein